MATISKTTETRRHDDMNGKRRMDLLRLRALRFKSGKRISTGYPDFLRSNQFNLWREVHGGRTFCVKHEAFVACEVLIVCADETASGRDDQRLLDFAENGVEVLRTHLDQNSAGFDRIGNYRDGGGCTCTHSRLLGDFIRNLELQQHPAVLLLTPDTMRQSFRRSNPQQEQSESTVALYRSLGL